ncbi:MAG: DUF4968 domain-containing protein, partial [Bacteroidaceae bacterium]|nr:DUF4968 domain-containing protein [Bacteroidaceae bacterium]
MKHIFRLLIFATFFVASRAEAKPVSVKWNGGETRVTFMSPSIVRVEHGASLAKEAQKSLVVTMLPEANVNVSVKDKAQELTLASETLKVIVNKTNGQVQFLTKGCELLREKATTLLPRLTQTYTLDADEPIYGLGALQDGKLNRRGTDRRKMEQSNLEDFQYVIQSIKGWGIYWDNYSRADFTDNDEGMTFSPETGDRIDYYFM